MKLGFTCGLASHITLMMSIRRDRRNIPSSRDFERLPEDVGHSPGFRKPYRR